MVVCLWHVVVNDNVDLLDVDTASQKVCAHQHSLLKVLELTVHLNPFVLLHPAVGGDRWKVAVDEEFVQGFGSFSALDENDHLIVLVSNSQICSCCMT